MASLIKTLIMKVVSLVVVLIGVLVLLAVIMGATGLSDRMLKSILIEEVQEYRQMLIKRG